MAQQTHDNPGAQIDRSAWWTRTPVLSSFADRWTDFLFARSRVEFRGVYSSREDAVRSIPRNGIPIGYDNESAAGYYRELLRTVRPHDYPVLFWLRELLRSGRLFEVGGHVGVAYYSFQQYLTHPDGLEWQIHDTPAVCESGRLLAAERSATNLQFTTDISHGDGADIFLSIGALQYLEFSLADILGGYRNRPRHVLINVTPVADRAPYFTVQNIGVAYCPYRIESRSELQSKMSALGYQLVDAWENPGKFCQIALHPEASLSHYEGFYFKKLQ